MIIPAYIRSVSGEVILNPISGGVMRSRLRGSLTKSHACAIGIGRRIIRSSTFSFIVSLTPVPVDPPRGGRCAASSYVQFAHFGSPACGFFRTVVATDLDARSPGSAAQPLLTHR